MVGSIEAGWIAFASARRRVGEAGPISVAVGRDHGRIAPVSGGTGAPEEPVAMSVDVKAVGLGSTPAGHDGGAATDKASRHERQP